MTLWLAEITGHDGEGLVVHRFAVRGYMTKSTDVPESVYYEPALSVGALFDRSLADDVASGGAVVIVNLDGTFDHLRSCGFGGHPLRLLRVADEQTAYADAVVELKGTQREPEWGVDEILFRLRERMADLEEPIQPERFAGDGAGGAFLTIDFTGAALPEGVSFARAAEAEYVSGGVRTVYAADVPRLLTAGLLIEAAATNLDPTPTDLSGWTGTGGTPTLVGGVTEFAESGGSGFHGLTKTLSGGVAGPMEGFFDLEYVAGQAWKRIEFARGGFNGGWGYFDLVNGVKGTFGAAGAGTGISTDIVPLGGGKYRCIVRCTTTSTGTWNCGCFGATGDGGSVSYTGSGGVATKFHRVQLTNGQHKSFANGTRPADEPTVDLPDGGWDILRRGETGATWLSATVAGGAGFTAPVDAADPFLRRLQFWPDGALTPEEKDELAALDLTSGLEGGAELTDVQKPQLWGGPIRQFGLVLLNAGQLLYGANYDWAGNPAAVEAFLAVYVGGVALIAAGDHATTADLLASTGLVVNGGFDADTDWTKGTGWAIGIGVAAKVAGTASDLAQAQGLVAGAGYVLTATVARTAGSLQFTLGGVPIGEAVVATGPVVIVFTGAAGDLAAAADVAFAGSLDDVRIVRSGSYETCRAEGRVRLASTPGAKVTADILEGAAADDRTAAGIVRRMALGPAAIAPEAIDGAVFDALVAAAPHPCAYVVQDGDTIAAAMRAVASSIDAVPFHRRDSVFSIAQLVGPAGEPDLEIEEGELVAALQLQPWTPVWRQALDYDRYWTVQGEGELAGAVDAARRADLGREYRTAWVAPVSALKVKHPGAREARAVTLLATRAGAIAEAQRRLDRDSVDRLPLVAAVCRTCAGGVELGATVRLTHRRYGLSAGRLYQVRAIRETDTALLLSLWG